MDTVAVGSDIAEGTIVTVGGGVGPLLGTFVRGVGVATGASVGVCVGTGVKGAAVGDADGCFEGL